MIIEGMLLTAAVLYKTNKVEKMDAKALGKYAKAFEKSEEAELLIKKKREYTEKRLGNVVKKKRAILQNTVPRFIEVYQQIQKIEIENKTIINEVALKESVQKLGVLQSMSLSLKKETSDKELLCGLLIKGVFGMMDLDSKKYLSAANSQMRASNVVYSQAQSLGEIYDAICGRADRISQLLMAMNALFVRSINETERVINSNGLNVRKYSEYDKGILMTCVNIAGAVSDIINVPVIDDKGQLCDAAIEMIETGEKYMTKMKNLL